MVTTSPSLIECLKETLSTDAVTTIRLQCFWADIAAAISIQCSKRPPIRFCKVLVSLGNTSSFIIVCDSLGVLSFMFGFCANIQFRRLNQAVRARLKKTYEVFKTS